MRCNTLILNLLWLRNGEEKRKKEEETTGQKCDGLPYTAAINNEIYNGFGNDVRFPTVEKECRQ